jgi:cell division protein FtsL
MIEFLTGKEGAKKYKKFSSTEKVLFWACTIYILCYLTKRLIF